MNIIKTKPRRIFDCRNVKIEYTQEQGVALGMIELFLSSDAQHFLLVGNAGTGKTTIAENIARYAKAGILAPTNAALKRLKDKLMSEDIPVHRFQTIHQSLYGAPGPTGKYTRKKNSMSKYKVYIVDEASMIEEKLLEDLLDNVEKRGVKIIFIGDDFQLEPIGKDPVLFKWEKQRYLFKEEWKYKLNEVRRNEGVILTVANKLRLSSHLPEILNYNTSEFKVVPKFTSELPLDISHDKDFVVLVSTNKRRMQYNNLIRKEKFQEDSIEPIVDSERLISVSNQVYMNGDMYTIRHPKIIENFYQKVNVGSIKYPEIKQYRFCLIEHEIENTIGSFMTLLVPDLDKPSLHSSSLMSCKFIFNHRIMSKYELKFGNKKIWNNNINIATYGYATSVHKSQGNEWDTVYIDCDWLSPHWNHARWLYTAITRAKKRVELKNSSYFNIIPKEDG